MSWEFDWLYALQGIHNPVLDKIMMFLSDLGNLGLFWMLISLAMVIPKKTRKSGLQVMAAMMLTFIVGNLILKNAVHRTRPCLIDTEVALLVKIPKDYSFPSGHAMNGITAALTIFFNNKKLGVPALILAVLISFSRLYNFVHFPTDVFAAAAIGICSAIFFEWLFRKMGWKQSFELFSKNEQ